MWYRWTQVRSRLQRPNWLYPWVTLVSIGPRCWVSQLYSRKIALWRISSRQRELWCAWSLFACLRPVLWYGASKCHRFRPLRSQSLDGRWARPSSVSGKRRTIALTLEVWRVVQASSCTHRKALRWSGCRIYLIASTLWLVCKSQIAGAQPSTCLLWRRTRRSCALRFLWLWRTVRRSCRHIWLWPKSMNQSSFRWRLSHRAKVAVTSIAFEVGFICLRSLALLTT